MKATGATQLMVTSVDEGRGLEAYRQGPSWYQAMNQTPVHELICKVVNPTPAAHESCAAERIDRWVGTVVRLKRHDKETATAN